MLINFIDLSISFFQIFFFFHAKLFYYYLLLFIFQKTVKMEIHPSPNDSNQQQQQSGHWCLIFSGITNESMEFFLSIDELKLTEFLEEIQDELYLSLTNNDHEQHLHDPEIKFLNKQGKGIVRIELSDQFHRNEVYFNLRKLGEWIVDQIDIAPLRQAYPRDEISYLIQEIPISCVSDNFDSYLTQLTLLSNQVEVKLGRISPQPLEKLAFESFCSQPDTLCIGTWNLGRDRAQYVEGNHNGPMKIEEYNIWIQNFEFVLKSLDFCFLQDLQQGVATSLSQKINTWEGFQCSSLAQRIGSWGVVTNKFQRKSMRQTCDINLGFQVFQPNPTILNVLSPRNSHGQLPSIELFLSNRANCIVGGEFYYDLVLDIKHVMRDLTNQSNLISDGSQSATTMSGKSHDFILFRKNEYSLVDVKVFEWSASAHSSHFLKIVMLKKK